MCFGDSRNYPSTCDCSQLNMSTTFGWMLFQTYGTWNGHLERRSKKRVKKVDGITQRHKRFHSRQQIYEWAPAMTNNTSIRYEDARVPLRQCSKGNLRTIAHQRAPSRKKGQGSARWWLWWFCGLSLPRPMAPSGVDLLTQIFRCQKTVLLTVHLCCTTPKRVAPSCIPDKAPRHDDQCPCQWGKPHLTFWSSHRHFWSRCSKSVALAHHLRMKKSLHLNELIYDSDQGCFLIRKHIIYYRLW